MKSVIIFGSQYGSARKYAEALSEKLQIDCFSYQNMRAHKKYDLILYIGSLYAGGVLGLKEILKKDFVNDWKKIIIITVGISDPGNTDNIRKIEANISKQLPRNFNKTIELFHVRGNLDYSRLCFKHKAMMKLLYLYSKRIPREKQNEETRTFIATYNHKVDFINLKSLECVIERYLQIIRNDTLGKH